MRELKFRAWDIKRKRYVNDLTVIKILPIALDKEISEGLIEIEQYTGLKDKNGKEIYEGDIVEDGLGDRATVKWNSKNALFGLFTKTHFEINTFARMFAEDLKVIGNIHENHELLEEE